MSRLSTADLRSIYDILDEWCDLKEMAVQNGDDFESGEQLEDNRRWVKDVQETIDKMLKEEGEDNL